MGGRAPGVGFEKENNSTYAVSGYVYTSYCASTHAHIHVVIHDRLVLFADSLVFLCVCCWIFTACIFVLATDTNV